MKPVFRLKSYTHPRLKWVVRAKICGKWVRKYFEKKTEAETYRNQKNIELENQGRESVEFSSALRVAAARAHEKLAPLGKTLDEAVAFYLDHLAKVQRSVSLSQAMTELIENRRTSGASEVYCYDLSLRLGRFCREFPDRNTEEIKTPEVDDWLAGLNFAPVTRNTFRRDLRTLFSFCMDRGYSSTNPIDRTRIAKEIAQPVGILKVQELAQLLVAAPASLIPYIAIGGFAGLRSVEIERLDWSHIDLESGLIEVTAKNSKTARRRLVKVLPNLHAWIAPYSTLTGPVIPLNLRWLLADARERAGIAKWPNNALRHSYASYHLARFNDAAALALEMGHTNTAMIFQHYREVVKPRDAVSYWEITPANENRRVLAFAS
jgi:integrase